MVAIATKRILVIDDNLNIQFIVQTSLRKLGGWQTVGALSGQEGLMRAEREPLDAIILEGALPDMDSCSFLQRLRLNPDTQKVPVIFLTKDSRLLEAEKFDTLGVVAAIAKPFDPLTLICQIATALNWKGES